VPGIVADPAAHGRRHGRGAERLHAAQDGGRLLQRLVVVQRGLSTRASGARLAIGMD
jgi:hypothetical protein